MLDEFLEIELSALTYAEYRMIPQVFGNFGDGHGRQVRRRGIRFAALRATKLTEFVPGPDQSFAQHFPLTLDDRQYSVCNFGKARRRFVPQPVELPCEKHGMSKMIVVAALDRQKAILSGGFFRKQAQRCVARMHAVFEQRFFDEVRAVEQISVEGQHDVTCAEKVRRRPAEIVVDGTVELLAARRSSRH